MKNLLILTLFAFCTLTSVAQSLPQGECNEEIFFLDGSYEENYGNMDIHVTQLGECIVRFNCSYIQVRSYNAEETRLIENWMWCSATSTYIDSNGNHWIQRRTRDEIIMEEQGVLPDVYYFTVQDE